MQFAIIDKALQVAAETPADVLEMLKHYRLDILQHADALASGHLVHTVPGGKDGGQWFAITSVLGSEWAAPYLARLAHLTGYTGPVPAIECPRYPGSIAAHHLQHTHIVESATLGSDGFVFRGYVHSQDWNGRTARDRYAARFAECVREGVGATKTEPEFLPVGNGGLLKRNPNYLRRHAPHPAASSASVLGAIYQWWLDAKATPGQRGIIARCMANHHTVCPRDDLGSYFLRMYDAGYRVDWGAPLVSFTEFAGKQ